MKQFIRDTCFPGQPISKIPKMLIPPTRCVLSQILLEEILEQEAAKNVEG